MADGDHIAARMAFRADLMLHYLWASQQAIEKCLKGTLVLNRIQARNEEGNHSFSRTIGHSGGNYSMPEPRVGLVVL